MKIYKIKILCLGWATMLTACNVIEEKKNDLAKSVTETALEKITGVSDIEVTDINQTDKNEATVDIVLNGKNLQGNFRTAIGTVTATQEGLAITVTQEAENATQSILLGFTGQDLASHKPFKGTMLAENPDQIKFHFSMMKTTDVGMETKMSQEAYGEILKLSDEEVTIKVSGKLSAPGNFESPQKWESYDGTITIKHPIYSSIGVSKSALNY